MAHLREVFPAAWVIDPTTKDYGIDIHVEVFTTDGNRTGIKFYGQVKATDNEEDVDLLKVDRDHLDYWTNHSDPVAIFRYYALSKSLHWCWVHEVAWRIAPDRQTLDISSYLRKWDPTISVDDIQKHLSVRRLALAPLPRPYQILICDEPNALKTSAELSVEISKFLGHESFHISLNAADKAHFQINISKKQIAVNYCGLPGFSFHVKASTKIEDLLGTALVGLLFCAHRYDRAQVVESIISTALPILYTAAARHNSQAYFFEILVFVKGCRKAFETIYPLIEREKKPHPIWIQYLAVSIASAYKHGDLDSLEDFLRMWKANPPVPKNSAMSAYNLGNVLSQRNKWAEAASNYKEALALEPEYANRDYFLLELGAATFESGTYDDAAQAYKKALALTNSQETRWRLADALYNAGQYKSALNLLEGEFDPKLMVEFSFAYAYLILLVCRDLTKTWGIDAQVVEELSAEEFSLVQRLRNAANEVEYVSNLLPMMRKNAIDHNFSFNAGIYASNSGLNEIAALRFVACALRNRGDGEAWARAFFSAFNARQNHLLTPIAINGRFFAPHDFFVRLQSGPNMSDCSKDLMETWKKLITEIMAHIDKIILSESKGTTLRVWGANKKMPPKELIFNKKNL